MNRQNKKEQFVQSQNNFQNEQQYTILKNNLQLSIKNSNFQQKEKNNKYNNVQKEKFKNKKKSKYKKKKTDYYQQQYQQLSTSQYQNHQKQESINNQNNNKKGFLTQIIIYFLLPIVAFLILALLFNLQQYRNQQIKRLKIVEQASLRNQHIRQERFQARNNLINNNNNEFINQNSAHKTQTYEDKSKNRLGTFDNEIKNRVWPVVPYHQNNIDTKPKLPQAYINDPAFTIPHDSQLINKKQKQSDQQEKQRQKQKQLQQQKMYQDQNIFAPITLTHQQQRFANQLKDIVFQKSFQNQKSKQKFQKEYQIYNEKYQIENYKNQIPFCIVVPSYNNNKQQRYLNNLNSITIQNYTNYHIVYIDDASTDGTGQQVEKYVKNNEILSNHPQKIKIIHNSQRKFAMPNLVEASRNHCKPNQIFLIIDGDDFLVGRNVLKLYNAIFQSGSGNDVWFLYSNSINLNRAGYSRSINPKIIDKIQYRKVSFMFSHLRAFYNELFLKIKDQDLKDLSGNYLKAANDVAICIPILQMSAGRVKYVDEITYFYNSNTGNNNHQIRKNEQRANTGYIRSLKPYQRLTKLFD